MQHKWVTLWIVVVSVLFSPFLYSGQAAVRPFAQTADLFPQYRVIDANVSFWIKIYSHYPTTQAVVHDSEDLDVVYDVIDLVPADQEDARKINRRRMKTVSDKYARILTGLAADPLAPDADSRRVAALFGERADRRTFAHARHQVRCQIGQRDRFQAGLIRSGAYIDRIRAILEAHGVPEDLAYLPHVESSFNIHAYSKFGAAGMWQFTRSTGKRFLTVDYVLDERRDPIAATHAAARLLKENYEKLGSWPLAITAYNHGTAGMQRAQAAHGAYPEVFASYKGPSFKFASRNFYSEFLAARRVASQYQSYFGDLDLHTPIQHKTLKLESFAAFEDLCGHFQVDPQVVRAMNPALRPPVFSGQKYVPKGYVLNLPAHVASDDPALANLPAAMIQTSQKASRFYTVQSGDTANKIARMHRIKLDDLILANSLDRRATVYVRQTLRIPQVGESIQVETIVQPPAPEISTIQVAVAESAKGQVTVAVTDPAEAASTLPDDLPVENATARYRRPMPSPADLLVLADTDSAKMSTDISVQDATVAPGIVSAEIGFSRLIPDRGQPVGIIHVEVEETLGHYAEWAGVRTSLIRQLNGLTFGRPLHLNQEIKIPLDKVPAEQFEAQRYEYHKRLQEDFFAAYRIGELKQYKVQAGDNYWSLCRQKFDLPLWLLRHYNADVNLASLRIRQPLTIPAIENVLENGADALDQDDTPDA